MKLKNYFLRECWCLYSAILLMIIMTPQGVSAQATCSSPANVANFGVDNDIKANTPASVLGDSWFYSNVYPGTGIGVIGTTAATATPPISSAAFRSIIQNATSTQGRNRTYIQRMSVPHLTNVNGMTLIDAFSARDNVSPDSTAFSGSNKNGDNPTAWSIGVNSVPNKNDLIDVGGHLRRQTIVSNDLWLFAYATRLSTTGDAYTDIEMYRTVPTLNMATGKLINTGPASTGGHTAFTFNSSAGIANPGDIILCVNYNASGGFASTRIWCDINNLDGNNNGIAWFNAKPGRPFNFTGDFISGANTNGYGYAEIQSRSSASCLIYSVLNSANTPAGDWGNLTSSSADFDTNIQPEQLVNIAFNFTTMGLDVAAISGPCFNVFGALMFKSRSSSSYSSELKDASGPYSFANFSLIDGNAGPDKVLNCSNPQTTLNGSSTTPNAIMTWYTPNGNIISGANTATPTVNSSGIYILTATNPLLSTCVAIDTVLVTSNFAIPNANAGPDKQITCSAPTVTLSGSSSTPGTLISWIAISGGNIVSGSNSATPVVNAAGCYVLTVTNPSNGCSQKDTVCVTLNLGVPVISSVTQTNISCFSNCSGAINFTTSGGQAPYTYAWSNGSTTAALSNLCPGNYTVTVTGSNGCTATASYSITQPAAALTSSVTITQNVSCNGGANGSATATGNGGTPPYNYLWSNGAVTSTVNGLVSGTYSVTITDNKGCTSMANATVTQPSNPIAVSLMVSQHIYCYGGNNGIIFSTPSGGTSPYSYLWNTGATTQNLTGIISGTYTITVTDINGCSAIQSTNVTQPPSQLVAVPSMTQSVSCFGTNTGGASVVAAGGTPPYFYSWSNGSTSAAISNVGAGIYTITVTDAYGCTTLNSTSVTQPSAALTTSITSTQNINCFGGNNGYINLTVTGGTAPYAYNWSNGATSQDLSNQPSGVYVVTVTDARGCTSSKTVTLTQPAAALSAAATATANVSCFGGNNGVVNLIVSNGTPAYTYNWSNGSITQNLTGVGSGTYSVSVTDANGCMVNKSVIVTQPAAALSSTIAMMPNVSCFGGNNGSLNLSVSNGTAPYTYLWSNGATTQDISSLTSGTYTVTITDANGCTNLQSGSISQPSAALFASGVSTNSIACFGGNNGAVDLTVSGGTSPYSYVWSNGLTTQDMGSLSAGTYTVMVTDANGCTATTGVPVTQPSAPLSTTITSSQNVNCFSGNTGSVNLTVTGGTSPYTYNWSNGATTQDLSGLGAGAYSVTVTDANGCLSTQSVTITQPSAALASSAVNDPNVSCFGGTNGSVNLTVTGGTTPYSYNWSNGQTTQDMSGLAAGNYTVTVTDVNGCTTTRTITITQPSAALSATASQSQAVSCNAGNDGQISLSVSGGTAPYTYVWSNGQTTQAINGLSAGTYTVTVTDANGCTGVASAIITQPSAALSGSTTTTSNISCFSGNNGSIDLTVAGGTAPFTYMWSIGAVTEDLTGLPAGSYSVTITDDNGCVATSSGIISQPAGSMAANLNVSQNVNCFGGGNGSLDLTVSGGTTPYTYTWSTGATTEDISGLAVGFYTVSITDANGCISSATGSITQPSAALSSTISTSQNVNCFGGNNGALNLTVNGGMAPYTYNWSNGATSQDINNLTNGTYTVSITDVNGCTIVQTGSVSQPAAALNALATATSNVSCYGGGNGTVNLTVTGGTAPYSYNWSNGETTEDISSLSAGIYTVNITDVKGCNTTATVTVTEPVAAVSITISSTTAISCFGGNDGEAAITASGGTAPYTYIWNTGATTAAVNGLSTGTYTVTVTDINGCSENATVTLSQPVAPLDVTIRTSQDVNCFGGNDGTADLMVIGGTSPYTFLWSNGATTEDVSGLSSGTYTVTVTDANNCVTTQIITISQPAASMSGSVIVTGNISCFSGNNGSIDLTVTGGTAPYIYLWSTGAVTEDVAGLGAGVYSVTVTDMNGCEVITNAQITQPAGSLAALLSVTQNVLCFSGNTGSLDLTVNGGTTPYSFIWNTGAVTEDLSGLITGIYTVNITDANGCNTSQTAFINEPSAALSSVINGTNNVSCIGGNNGNVDLEVTGGTTPYSYNWSNGEINEDLTGLVAGTYSVTVTDANGCTSDVSITITEPTAALNPVLTLSQQVNCFGGEDGSIDLNITGGTVPYFFIWSTGDTTQNISNLMAGTYVVIVTDANGCEGTSMLTLNQPVAPILGLISITSNVFCNGGSSGALDLNVNGGTIPYTFIWSNGETTEDISNLTTGIYTVTVTDANGCTTTVTEGIGQPGQQLQASITTNHVLCFNGNNGLIDITPVGGTAPYAFNWSTGSVSEDLVGLYAGTYTVTITDANGCDTTFTISINQPSAPLIPIITIAQNVSCFGGNDGSINLTVTGGTLPYMYLWSNGLTTSDISGLGTGAYSVTVTDANGCNAIISDFVFQPAAPLETPLNVSQQVLCFGGSDGALTTNATGGSAPYSYLWNTGETTSGLAGLQAGTYTVTVTDSKGCTYSATAQITQPIAPLEVTGTTTMANCLNGQGGTITIQVTGGTPAYSYLWSNGATTQNIANAMPGTYTVTVTDANGCSTTAAYSIENSSDFNLNAGPVTICIGETATLFADSIAGATYQWYFEGNLLNGANGISLITPAAGFYFVTATVPCGTFYSDSIEVIVKSIQNASITDNQTICPPETVHLQATGGVTYEWSPSSFMTLSNIPDPIVSPPVNMIYSVLITNEWGCKITKTVDITVDCDTLFVPNGFSPNDDGTNDGFVIDGIENYPGNRLWVFNRWGNLVFKTKNYDNNWDGISNVSGIYMAKKVPSGTYYFILDLNDKSKQKAGFLIIRR